MDEVCDEKRPIGFRQSCHVLNNKQMFTDVSLEYYPRQTENSAHNGINPEPRWKLCLNRKISKCCCLKQVHTKLCVAFSIQLMHFFMYILRRSTIESQQEEQATQEI